MSKRLDPDKVMSVEQHEFSVGLSVFPGHRTVSPDKSHWGDEWKVRAGVLAWWKETEAAVNKPVYKSDAWKCAGEERTSRVRLSNPQWSIQTIVLSGPDSQVHALGDSSSSRRAVFLVSAGESTITQNNLSMLREASLWGGRKEENSRARHEMFLLWGPTLWFLHSTAEDLQVSALQQHRIHAQDQKSRKLSLRCPQTFTEYKKSTLRTPGCKPDVGHSCVWSQIFTSVRKQPHNRLPCS